MTIKQLQQEIQRIIEDLKSPLASKIGKLAVDSVRQNFDEGGRPIKWIPSQRAIREHNKTLIDTGALYDSISYEINNNNNTIISVGSDIEYASEMNDDREFLLLQDEDLDEIEDLVVSKVLKVFHE